MTDSEDSYPLKEKKKKETALNSRWILPLLNFGVQQMGSLTGVPKHESEQLILSIHLSIHIALLKFLSQYVFLVLKWICPTQVLQN